MGLSKAWVPVSAVLLLFGLVPGMPNTLFIAGSIFSGIIAWYTSKNREINLKDKELENEEQDDSDAIGKIEIDESSEDAVIRELNEELDIVVRKPKKIMQYLHRFKNLIYDISFFEVTSFKGSIKKIVHDELEWVDLASINNYNFISGDLLIIEGLLNKPSLVEGLE